MCSTPTATLKDIAKILVLLTVAACSIIATVQFVQVSNRAEESITRLTRDTTLMERAFRDMASAMKDTYIKDTEIRDKLVAIMTAMENTLSDASGGFRKIANAVENSLAAIPPAAQLISRRLDETSRECEVFLRGVGGDFRELLADTRQKLIPKAADTIDATCQAISGIPPLLSETTQSVRTITARLDNELQGVKPVLDETAQLISATTGVAKQAEKVVESGANVAKHYEKMILHPSTSQRIKGWLQLFFSGMTVFANSKILF